MNRLLEGFDAYASAQVPAVGVWTSGANVTIGAGEGRSGSASDNAAFFDTAQGSVLRRALILNPYQDVYTVTYGHAVRIVSLTEEATLAAIDTAISEFNLIANVNGSLRLQQVSGGVDLGNICQTAQQTIPVGAGGFYAEIQILFVAGESRAAKIRVSDQFGGMNAVAQGPLLALDAADLLPNVTFRLGGGVADGPATWWVDDVYLNDGVPAAPMAYKSGVLYNDSFFGNTHIETVYATADGVGQETSGNVPWTPSAGAQVYAMIDEHPPDEDGSYIAATDNLQLSTCLFAGAVIRQNCASYAPIYALQWDGRMRVESSMVQVVAIVRRVVTGVLADDVLASSQAIVVTSTEYQYYPQNFDRNPTQDDAPWTFKVFDPAGVGVPGTTEFGAMIGSPL